MGARVGGDGGADGGAVRGRGSDDDAAEGAHGAAERHARGGGGCVGGMEVGWVGGKGVILVVGLCCIANTFRNVP